MRFVIVGLDISSHALDACFLGGAPTWRRYDLDQGQSRFIEARTVANLITWRDPAQTQVVVEHPFGAHRTTALFNQVIGAFKAGVHPDALVWEVSAQDWRKELAIKLGKGEKERAHIALLAWLRYVHPLLTEDRTGDQLDALGLALAWERMQHRGQPDPRRWGASQGHALAS